MNRVLHVMKIALPDPSKSLRMYSIGLSSNSSSSTAIKHKSSIHVFSFFLSCYLLLMTTFGRAIFSHMFFNASSLSKIGLSVSNRTKMVNTAKALQINYTKKSQDPYLTSCSNMSLTPSYFNSLPVVVKRLTIIGTNWGKSEKDSS